MQKHLTESSKPRVIARFSFESFGYLAAVSKSTCRNRNIILNTECMDAGSAVCGPIVGAWVLDAARSVGNMKATPFHFDLIAIVFSDRRVRRVDHLPSIQTSRAYYYNTSETKKQTNDFPVSRQR